MNYKAGKEFSALQLRIDSLPFGRKRTFFLTDDMSENGLTFLITNNCGLKLLADFGCLGFSGIMLSQKRTPYNPPVISVFQRILPRLHRICQLNLPDGQRDYTAFH